jgi:uncharacterized protein (TIGR02300 family)
VNWSPLGPGKSRGRPALGGLGGLWLGRRGPRILLLTAARANEPSEALFFEKFSRIAHVAKSDLGTKRICPTTGKKFYDLNKNPVISPYTGEVVRIAPIPPPRTPADAAARARAAAAAAAEATPEPVEAEELVPLDEADAEENTGKVKAVVPESEDDIEIDEDDDDDDDDDSTIIADEEEGDEDVTDIIGDVGDDKEKET